MRILVTDGMDKTAMAQLREMGHEVVEQFYEPDQLGKALRDFDVVVVRSKTKVRANHIDEAKGGKLKLIIRGGVGVDNIDVKYAEANGITVKNTPKASSQSVAELAMGHMFSCARYLSIAGHTMRENKWEKKAYSKGFELSGKTMGVIGYGRIGQLVGAKGQALGMNVLSVVHCNKPEGCECETMHFVTMDELLSQSDIIVLCAPSGDKPLVDAESLAKMKDGVILVNTSRGGLVNTEELIEGIRKGKFFAVGLDVYEEENDKVYEDLSGTILQSSTMARLLSFPNVMVTSHQGFFTREALEAISRITLENAAAFEKGETLVNEVTK